jgi:predicted ATPase
LTQLVGREEELELLSRRWSKAKGGEGQVVLLSGEPRQGQHVRK